MSNSKKLRVRIGAFLGSYRGKTIFNFFYGFGASLAILGTMFKLLHLDYANVMLAVGLGTEVFIFALSAFEPPYRTYRWDEVFPILKSHKEEDRPDFSGNGGVIINGTVTSSYSAQGPQMQQQAQPFAGNVQPETGQPQNQPPAGQPYFTGQPDAYNPDAGSQPYAAQPYVAQPSAEEKYRNPVAGITPQQAMQSYGIPPQVQLSEEDAQTLSESIKRMGEAVTQLNNMADITQVTEKYLNQLSEMADNLNRFSTATASLSEVSNVLLDSYKNITENSTDISDNSKGYVEQMGILNKNLLGLNTIYEIQLKSISSQIDTIDRVNKGLLHIRDMYEGSMDDSNRFHQETEAMSNNLSKLNVVYSRMLEAMTQGVVFPGGIKPKATEDDNI